MKDGQHYAGTALAIAVDADGPLAGVLFTGAPARGKSSLAAALIETCPWRRSGLVADDAVLVENRRGAVWMRAPAAIAGLVEIRGFGPAPVYTVPAARLAAVFDLCSDAPRLPDPEDFCIAGATFPKWPLSSPHGAEHRIRIILRALLAGQTP